jgi:hypothetical protein
MGEGTDYSRRGRATLRARILCYSILFCGAGSEAAPVALPGQVTGPALSDEGRVLVAEALPLTFSVKDIEAESGSDTAITVAVPSEAELRAAGSPTSTFVLIRNIPEGVIISPGMASGRIRVVPLRDAPSLRLLSRPDINTQFQLEFYLIGQSNRALAQATAAVTLHPRPAFAAPAPAPTSPKSELPTAAVQPRPEPEPLKPPAQALPAPSKQPAQAEPLSSEVEAVLLARGRNVLQQGGIAAARIMFEELASAGSAAGAFALAQTYDPALATRAAGAAPPPSLAEARRWYQRAAELGNADAERRLAEIGSGR